tara:strand:+ start:1124 stop:1564 length:441 start_codon:yes stop_codon:yes gene_type:complete
LVSIAKFAVPIIGVIFLGLFLKEASATSFGSAGRSFGSGLGAFFTGIGGFGESINQLGTGIGAGVTGLFRPVKEIGGWFGLFDNTNSPANQSGSTNPSIGGVVTSGSTSQPTAVTASTSSNTTGATTPSQSFGGGYTSEPSYGWGG